MSEEEADRIEVNIVTAKVLELSTAHITSKDNGLLQESSDGKMDTPVIADRYEFGFWVLVPEELCYNTREEILREGFSLAFVEVLQLCKNHNIKWLRLDCDGSRMSTLPEFKW